MKFAIIRPRKSKPTTVEDECTKKQSSKRGFISRLKRRVSFFKFQETDDKSDTRSSLLPRSFSRSKQYERNHSQWDTTSVCSSICTAPVVTEHRNGIVASFPEKSRGFFRSYSQKKIITDASYKASSDDWDCSTVCSTPTIIGSREITVLFALDSMAPKSPKKKEVTFTPERKEISFCAQKEEIMFYPDSPPKQKEIFFSPNEKQSTWCRRIPTPLFAPVLEADEEDDEGEQYAESAGGDTVETVVFGDSDSDSERFNMFSKLHERVFNFKRCKANNNNSPSDDSNDDESDDDIFVNDDSSNDCDSSDGDDDDDDECDESDSDGDGSKDDSSSDDESDSDSYVSDSDSNASFCSDTSDFSVDTNAKLQQIQESEEVFFQRLSI